MPSGSLEKVSAKEAGKSARSRDSEETSMPKKPWTSALRSLESFMVVDPSLRMRASMAQAIVRVDTKTPAAVPASGRCVKHPGANELAAGRRGPPRGSPANPNLSFRVTIDNSNCKR